MAATIIWRTEALDDYLSIILFLYDQDWPEKIIDRFEEIVKKAEHSLSMFPARGAPVVGASEFRRLVLHQNIVLTYQYFEDLGEVHFVRLSDPRQDPSKLTF